MGSHTNFHGDSGSGGDSLFSMPDSGQRFDRKLIEPYLLPLLVFPHLDRSMLELSLCLQNGNPVNRTLAIIDRNIGKRIGNTRTDDYLPLVDRTFQACGIEPLKHCRLVYRLDRLRLERVLVQVLFLADRCGEEAVGAVEGRR